MWWESCGDGGSHVMLYFLNFRSPSVTGQSTDAATSEYHGLVPFHL